MKESQLRALFEEIADALDEIKRRIQRLEDQEKESKKTMD